MLSLPGGSDQIAYYRRDLSANWRLLVLDTTDLSVHGGWPEDSPQFAAATEYMNAHAGEDRMKRWNGGLGKVQLEWLKSELEAAKDACCRVIVASHHCLLRGASRETHRAWNGDEVCELLHATPGLVALCLAGHDHVGGFACVNGVPHVTLEAVLEAPIGSNAYAVATIHDDRIEICGWGTSVTSRSLPLQPSPWPEVVEVEVVVASPAAEPPAVAPPIDVSDAAPAADAPSASAAPAPAARVPFGPAPAPAAAGPSRDRVMPPLNADGLTPEEEQEWKPKPEVNDVPAGKPKKTAGHPANELDPRTWIGHLVEIHGLKSEEFQDLNGEVGTAVRYVPRTGRMGVALPNVEGNKALKLLNLRLVMPEVNDKDDPYEETPHTAKAALLTECFWLVEGEVDDVITSTRKELEALYKEIYDQMQPTARTTPLRGGSSDDGFVMAAVVGGTSLHALRVQVDAFPKWNNGQPYSGMLLGGQRASFELPALIYVYNRIGQALCDIQLGHRTRKHSTTAVTKTLERLRDIVELLDSALCRSSLQTIRSNSRA